MKKIVVIPLLILAFFAFFKVDMNAQELSINEEERIEARVIRIIENSKIIEDDGSSHPYQRLELLGTSGSYKDKKFVVENGAMNQVGIVEYKKGDQIALLVTPTQSGNNIITIYDYVRRTPLLLLFGVFIVLTILVGGRRGANSILGMVITFALIFFYVLPQLSKGSNPTLVIAIASLIIIPVTFCLSHGLNKKTLSAIIGTFIALIIAGILSHFFIISTHLSGFASEEAGFLDVIKKGTIDMRNLLFAGIIVALLGILEDITISQSAIVFQLKKANINLSHFELFKRAMDIGRDHIASMANTLILVYAGASLPLLLLFTNSSIPFLSVINSEIIAEEIVRTLAASTALILAVPITTAVSVLIAGKKSSS